MSDPFTNIIDPLIEKLRSLPEPPPSDIDGNPKNSALTTLANGCIVNHKGLGFKELRRGEPHIPWWTLTCFIDGKEYGKGESSKKNVAKVNASRETLEMLKNEGEAFPTAKMSYLPIFNDYRNNAGLEDRLQYACVFGRSNPLLGWWCTIAFDDVPIGFAQAQKKELAMEGAARNVADNWHTLT